MLRSKFYFLTQLFQVVSAASILNYVNKGEFLDATKRIMNGFTSTKEISTLNICHVFPAEQIYEALGTIFLDDNGMLKSTHNIEIEKLKDFKTDIFKVHTDAAYLKEANMATRTKFYSLNSKFQTQLESVIDDIDKPTEIPQETYLKKINLINTLFYNAPANLRASGKCINDDSPYIDPNLLEYTGKSHTSLSSFTQQSRYLTRKYSLLVPKDISGYIQTTDKNKVNQKKSYDNSTIMQNLNVFQMYEKNIVNDTNETVL